MKKTMKLIAIVCLLMVPVLLMGANLVISWPAAPAEEQILYYEVFMGTNGVTPGSSPGPTITTTETTATITNIAPGQYGVQVRGVNLAGPGGFSSVATTPPPPLAIGTPTLTVVQ